MDFSIDSQHNVIDDDASYVMQQIDILFDTTPTEVLGSEEFGTRYEDFLYNLSISNEGVKSQIESDLSTLDMRGFKYDVNVQLFVGTENDIALVQINLYKNGRSYQKNYKMR